MSSTSCLGCRGFLAIFIVAMGSPIHAADSPLRERIDAEIEAAWKREKVTPAGLADDSVFLRRIYLDLVGTIPTYDETAAFFKNDKSDKRTQLIDQLLADPRFAAQQAAVWERVLLGRSRGDQDGTRALFRKWLVEKFAQNVPYDQLVKDLLLTTGEVPGPARFFVEFNKQPEQAAMTVSRIFMGTQLQCAQCHDDRRGGSLTQKDFYGFAAFFVRLTVVDAVGGKGKPPWIAEKSTGEMMFSGPAAQQEPGKKGTAVPARYLAGVELKEPELPKDYKEVVFKGDAPPPAPFFSRRKQMVEWLATGDNPYFARAVANRVWAQFMGRGLVHLVDDLRDKNPPSHPVLFETLHKELVAHQFDLKWLIREIVNSRAYQLAPTSKPETPIWFEAGRIRALTVDEMLAALNEATGAAGIAKKASELDTRLPRYFADASRDGEEDYQASLHERLFIDNSSYFRQALARRDGNLADVLLKSTAPWEERVDRLFLTILNRPPRPKERELMTAHLKSNPQQSVALVEEAIWALTSSSEFRFNR